ncbi:IgGFc-binding protein [Nannocystis radixulma]|uniref:IgGFc-binding protein n=1 Tax=Nannocystis radixulma TaxID=2995305 RepID=A0ABT5BIP7_9BACT|nr:IgGFc-binding protein [Nannocystis radixulma]MDC0673268.1 IgGFc-binding protein [Nannocystis radixulma]
MLRSTPRPLISFGSIALALAGCSGPGGRADSGTETSITSAGNSNPTLPTTASPTSETGTGTDSSASESGTGTEGTPTTTDSAVTTDNQPKLDIGGPPDFGGGDTDDPPPLPLTCDNIAMQPATSVGCEFWGVDLPMLQSNELAYGISVGNMSEGPAMVTIEDLRGPGGTLRVVTQFEVAPKHSQLIKINGPDGVSPGDHKVAANGLTPAAAFRVTSTVPVTAMQINPVGGGPSHVAEASLLLPRQALATSHFAASYPSMWNKWAVVVAVEDGTTITTTTGDAALDAFDAWTFVPNSDTSAFFVGSDKPVAVFSGTDCVLIPGSPWYACDHLEEQMVPLASWGTSYVGARHPQRVPDINPAPEEVRWRIVGAVAGSTVQLQPPQPGVGGMINIAQAGQIVEFASTESFVATGDQPFMLMQFMTGCYNVITQTGNPQNCSQGPTGDPYMIQVPPIEQWMTQLPFLTDTSYPRDFAIIMREAGTTVELDCVGVVTPDHFTAIAGTNYEVGYVELDDNTGEGTCVDGAHFISADAPIGVMVAGLDWATSYGYPGGLNFKSLWVPPDEPPM